MRIDVSVAEALCRIDVVTLSDEDVLSEHDGVLVLLAVHVGHVDDLLALLDRTIADYAADACEHCNVPRLAGLEQLSDSRKTTGDVLRLDAGHEQSCQNLTFRDELAVLDLQV